MRFDEQSPVLPVPGNLYGWAIYWQQRAAALAAEAREWRDRDATISTAYQETACTYYARARRLLCTLLERSHGFGPEPYEREQWDPLRGRYG